MQDGNILHEWVLFLDADEFVTTAFVNQLEIKTKTPIIIVPRYSLRTILWVKNYDMAIGCLVIATNSAPMIEVRNLAAFYKEEKPFAN